MSPPNEPETPSSGEPDRAPAEGQASVEAEELSSIDRLARRLTEVSAEIGTLRDDELRKGLADLERDLCAEQCALAEKDGGAREHPALQVAMGWSDRLRRAEESEAALGVERLSSEMLIRGLRDRERRGLDVLEACGDAAAEECTERVSRADRDALFDSLIAVEELRQRVEGRGERIGPAVEADTAAVCDDAARVQTTLRSALEFAVGAYPPSRELRHAWAGRLIDLADETVLGATERDPRVAARLLGESRRAIKWHLRTIEGGKGEEARRLKRRLRRVEVEQVEQLLTSRLEKRFGKRNVERWERAVLVAILVVVGMLFVSFGSNPTGWVLVVDTAVCVFLLWDFLYKAITIRFHGAWIRRHIFTDFIPALPFAWVASLEPIAKETGQLARLLRLLRIGQLARSLRLVLPVIRMFRAFSFLVRGLDRLVRRNTKLLESEVLLFPSSEERREARERSVAPEAKIWRLRSELDGHYEALLDEREGDVRTALANSRLDVLRESARFSVAVRDNAVDSRAQRRESMPMAEDLVRKLSSIGSEEVEGRIGAEAVRRVARGARLVSRSPLRFAPWLGRWAPSDAADLPDRRVASRTVRTVARSFHTLHSRVLWWADLRGTLTPGELVGRVGSSLVARTSRPAIRLLMLGGVYVLIWSFVQLLNLDDQAGVGKTLWGYVRRIEDIAKAALIVLGSICLVLLAVGVWLQRLARDTTTFHEQVARAQFLHLTDSIKARQRVADAKLLAERVFRPERNLFERDGAREASERDEARFVRHLERFLAEGTSPPSRDEGFDPVARAVMLHRDLLDGALLTHSDTRATSQLLGNLAIQRMIEHAGRIDKSAKKALLKIDLERRRTFIRGPYLWFHSISRALSSRSAKLIVDYNAHAIPVSELSRTADAERERYEAWLDGSLRGQKKDDEDDSVRASALGKAPQLTTAFTVLHFLDNAPARDAEVGARFGEAVYNKLMRDRRALVRAVFGTFPLHRLPLESRVLNLRALYGDWIEGGKVLLVPLRLVGLGIQMLARGLRSLWRAVRAIRNPERAFEDLRDAEADFVSAARKIGRMRAPGARAGIHLRAILDPEYHGLALPFGLHDVRERDQTSRSPASRDAAFLDSPAAFHDRLAALSARAGRCIRHLERAAEEGLLARIGERLGTPIEGDQQSLRALTVLVLADDDGLRSGLFGRQVFEETMVDALEFGLPAVGMFPPIALRLRFRRYWRQEGGREALMAAAKRSGVIETSKPTGDAAPNEAAPDHRSDRAAERLVKRAAWRSLWADADGCRAAFDAMRSEQKGDTSQDQVEARLAEALRHPGRVTEQLVTLRTVQTLGLVDVRNYRRHVWSLGQYEKDGDRGDVLLDLPSS